MTPNEPDSTNRVLELKKVGRQFGTDPAVSFSVYDLGGRPEGPAGDVSDEQMDARRRLSALVSTLRGYESLLGDEIVSGPSPLALHTGGRCGRSAAHSRLG